MLEVNFIIISWALNSLQWKSKTSIYSSIMSLNRFKLIKRIVTFYHSTTCNDKWKKDKFLALGEVFEIFTKPCARNYTLDDFLAIDETLYLTRGSIEFKTYTKDKLGKYELNFWSLRRASKAYDYSTIPYCGKLEVITDAYIGDTLTLEERIVEG